MAKRHKPITYFLLDAARILGELDFAQKMEPDFLCLFHEKDGLDSVAPYLFSCLPDSAFAQWISTNGWGKSWGIAVETMVTKEELKNHFGKLLVIRSAKGSESYFRFYDPRVIKVLLPTYNAQKLVEFFGPVQKFIVEGDSQHDAMEFSLQNGILKTKKVEGSSILITKEVTGK